MSKGKKRRQKGQSVKPKSVLSANVGRRNYSGIVKPASKKSKPPNSSSPSASKKYKSTTTAKTSQASQKGLSVPFTPAQKILLVGEGDFSFSHSLLTRHKCTRLVATTFETRETLLEKHPQAAEHISAIEKQGTTVPTTTSSSPGTAQEQRSSSSRGVVLYGVDGTVLGQNPRGGGAQLRRLGPFDRVVFNFPHVGGVTRDVNRQVRANQELCVGFLGAAAKSQVLAPGGRVAVTLFEGDPYELWGIRNLARHVGLAVDRSARFEWELYPGYSHARTLGNLKGEGGWKGEDRRARMYLFARPGEEDRFAKTKKKKKKESEGMGSDESDEEIDSGVDDYLSDPNAEENDDEVAREDEVRKSDNDMSGKEEEEDES